MTAREIYELIMEISQPRNEGKPLHEIETRTEKTARLPLENLIWTLCKPNKELANEVWEIAKDEFNKAWECNT